MSPAAPPPPAKPSAQPEEPQAKDQPPPERPAISLSDDLVLDVRSMMLTGLFLIASVAALWFAKPVLMPVVIAALLGFLLMPIVNMLNRMHVPQAVGAALALIAVLGAVAGGLYRLSGPAGEWMNVLPEHLDRIEDKLRELRRPIERVQQATEQVEELGQDSAATAATDPVPVQIEQESFTEIALSEARGAAVVLVLVVTLLYFLLASGDRFLQKLVKVQPRLADKKRSVEIVRQIKSDVSAYLLTVTLINIGLGAAVALAMHLLEMPTPLLWGVMATVLNYVPYLGALVGTAIVAMVAAIHFEGIGAVLAAPTVYIFLTSAEGYIVTPMILGARLTLSPVVIFIGLIFWTWLWGIPGALIAVPMLVVMKIICDRIEPLKPVGEFLGQ